MHSIRELQDLVNSFVSKTRYEESPTELYEPISYLMSLGGKRLRPVLVMVAAEIFGGDVRKALEPAIGIELFHNFTLMHDDIMDKAPLRRGQPTVHEKWNANAAILSGDVMFVEAYKMMIRVDDTILRDVLDVFSDTASGVCQGQQLDMNFEIRKDVTVAEYIEMIRLKTAILVGGAMRIGALIGGADKEQSAFIYDFGENLGLAFQIQDDILDVYGDPEKFGKQVGGDIVANKKTFMLTSAIELAQGSLADDLKHWLDSVHEPAQKVQGVKDIYDQLNLRTRAEEKMNEYAERALTALDRSKATEEGKELLRAFAKQLLIREN